MNSVKRERNTFALISFFLSIVMAIYIFKFLYYKMNAAKATSFSSFEAISLLLLVFPILLGAVSLFRSEKMYGLSITGIAISVITVHELISMGISTIG